MKVLFLGTGDIAIPSFQALIESAEYDVCGLICQPDKPVGRKQVLTPPRIKTIAEEHGIDVFQPRSMRKPEALAWIQKKAPDLIVVMAYGQILPQSILDAPPVACLNLHASILPKYRGAAPIQAAIREGDAESGVTVMHMAAGLDTGDILLIKTIPLAADETGGSLHDRLADLAPEAMLEALSLLKDGKASRTPQDDANATHIGKLDRHDGVIHWSQPAEKIDQLIRAYDPWPGTSTKLPGGRQLKVFPPCEIIEGAGCADPGTILSADKTGILIAAGGENALRITDLQPEGKKRMPAHAFLAGNPLAPGGKLT